MAKAEVKQQFDKIANVGQLGGIDSYVIDEGAGRGVRVLCINTGGGLRYRVLVDRGFDVDQAFMNQHSLAFLSHLGVSPPTRALDRGIDWLRGWPAGLLTSCGPLNVGAPSEDAGESLGLHGTHSTSAGTIESIVQPDPRAGSDEMSVVGRVRYGKMFGPSVELKRTIRSTLGENRIAFEDEFFNSGNTTVPHGWLLHINLGYPLCDAGAQIVWPGGKFEPRPDSASKAYFAKGRNAFRMPEPLSDHAGTGEVVSYLYPTAHDRTDRAGRTTAAVVNRKLGLGLAVHYSNKEFPRCATWQHWGKHEYVTGIEPMNGTVEGRARDRERGLMDELEPGERKKYSYEIEVVSEKAALAALLKLGDSK